MFWPSSSNRTMVDAADRLQGWILAAKQQAKRDNRPTGVRLSVVNGTIYVNTVQYVQQPDDFIGPYTPPNAIPTCTYTAANASVTFTFPSGGSLWGTYTAAQVTQNPGLSLVLSGDYLEFDGGGPVYPIASVSSSTVVTLPPSLLPASASYVNVPFRIIRQPRVVLGEEPLLLPGNTLIDTSQSPNLPPVRTVYDTGSAVTCYEILFGPSGAVVGPAASHDMIFLWLFTQNNTAPPVLVTIRTRTGLIGVNPVNQSPGATDAYSFARDGRASGM